MTSDDRAVRIPHIGWNDVEFDKTEGMYAGLGATQTYYFVHSFAAEPADPALVLGRADYGGGFCAAAGRGRVMGVQFHPEKSSRDGLRLLHNFVNVAVPA